MSHWEAILILYAAGVAMCGISLWVERKKMMATKGAILAGIGFTLFPVVNYIAAVAVIIEGGWGSQKVNWK